MGMAIRDAYGKALVQYGGPHPAVVVLDADVSSSTKSSLFAQAYPERFFNVGISEQNMVGMAAGMAVAGKIPFVNTFAVFLSTLGALAARSAIAYSGLNVKLMGAYGGLSDAYDGASHHSLEDIAIFRAIPGMCVQVASDAVQTEALVRQAIDTKGPLYLRLSRDKMDTLYQPGEGFPPGKGKVLREGGDVTLIGCGVMTGRALRAAETLADRGIQARVVDLFSIKPLDTALLLDCAAHTGALVTAEEHNTVGGMGGAVAEAVATGARSVPIEMVGVKDCFTESGSYGDLTEKYGLGVRHIVEAAERALARK